MKHLLPLLATAVLVAAVVLHHLITTPADATSTPAVMAVEPHVMPPLQRLAPVDRQITITVGQPIPPGLPPWSKPLATLREPPAPQGTTVPVVPLIR